MSKKLSMDYKTEYISTDIDPFYIGSNASCMSHDGSILVTANEEDVVVTNLHTQEILHTIEGDGETITNLNITPDGSKISIISQSQQLRIFDISQGVIVKNFKLSSPVYVSSNEQTSTLFAFGGTDGIITVWDIEGGYVTHSLKGHGSTISSISFNGDLGDKNWKLASGDTSGTVKVWDLVKRKCVHTFNEHTSAVRGTSFHGDHFISGGRDEIVVIYRNFKPIKTILVNQSIEVCKLLELPDSDDLGFYTAGSNNLFQLFDITGELITKTENYQTEEELIIIDVFETQYLNLVLSDQSIVTIDINDLTTGQPAVIDRIAGNHGIIADVKYVGPQFNLLALATNSPSLRIIDPSNPLKLTICEGHRDILNTVDVSVDGKWIVTGSKDSEVRLWNYADGTFKTYAILKGHVGSVTAVALPRTPMDYPQFVVSAGSDLTIKKWKIPNPAKSDWPMTIKTSEYTRRAHEKDINSIDISPNDEFLATASYDKLGKIWDLHTGETIGVLKGHKRGLWDIKFNKYDKTVITCGGDKTIKLWSLLNYQMTENFESHTNSVQKVQYITRGQQIISAGADGLIKIWNNKAECLKTIDNHSNRIWSIDILNDGDKFVSCDANGQISLWHDNSESLLKAKEQQEIDRIEIDQKLSNYINEKNYYNAFLLALELNYSMKLFHVINEIFNNDQSDQLVEILGKLNDEQKLKLFEKLQNWNINFKFFEVVQRVVNLILNNVGIEYLMTPKLIKIIENMLPYNERHLSRLEGLIESSYIVDYSVEQMGLTTDE